MQNIWKELKKVKGKEGKPRKQHTDIF